MGTQNTIISIAKNSDMIADALTLVNFIFGHGSREARHAIQVTNTFIGIRNEGGHCLEIAEDVEDQIIAALFHDFACKNNASDIRKFADAYSSEGASQYLSLIRECQPFADDNFEDFMGDASLADVVNKHKRFYERFRSAPDFVIALKVAHRYVILRDLVKDTYRPEPFYDIEDLELFALITHHQVEPLARQVAPQFADKLLRRKSGFLLHRALVLLGERENRPGVDKGKDEHIGVDKGTAYFAR